MLEEALSWVRFAAELVGYATVLVGAPLAVWHWLRPSAPPVLIHGPGAGLNHVVESGTKRWTEVTPSWALENIGESALFDVRPGIRTCDGRSEQHYDQLRIPVIQPRARQRVDSLALSLELLGTVAFSPNPHRQLVYWARFRDAKGRWWEISLDPSGPMPKVARLHRFDPRYERRPPEELKAA